MIWVSRSTSLRILRHSSRASLSRSPSSSSSSSVLSPIDDSGLRTSCATWPAILPAIAIRAARSFSSSRSWTARPIELNSRARSAISVGPVSEIRLP